MSNAIQDAIAKAQSAAAAFVPATTTEQKAVATYQPAQALTFDQNNTGNMVVDDWLKVSYFGLQIGTNRQLFDTLELSLALGDISYNRTIKYGKSPVTYLKSYDGVTCVSGGTWAEAIARARGIEPNARDYASADV